LIGAFPGEEISSSERTLAVVNRLDKRVDLRGPFEGAVFNRCVLLALIRGEGRLTLEALQGDARVGEPLALELGPSIDAQELVFDLPAAWREAGRLDLLRFEFEGRIGPIGIRRLELLDFDPSRPPPVETSLPAGSLARVRNGEASRRAWGLSEGMALRARFVPEPGLRLRLAACVDPLARESGGETAPQLQVVLSGASADADFRGRILKVTPLGESWSSVEIDLGLYADVECELLVQLDEGGGAPALALVEVPRLLRSHDDPPTVVLFTSDTHRGDHLAGEPGAGDLRTPALDGLRAEGLSFTRAFSTSNITLPSHAALLTGHHPRDTGVVSNTQGLSEAAPTLAEAFAAEGWSTVAAVSARHLYDWGGVAQGFERFDTPLQTQRPGQRTLAALLRDLADFEDQPLFVWLHLYDPHGPYEAPRGVAQPYLDALSGEALSGDALEDEHKRAEYRGEISHVDRLLAQLLELPRMGSAQLAFTADHGENLGEATREFDHRLLYQPVVHVPLVLAGPALPQELRGRRVGRNTQHLGIGRTLLDLAGLAAVDFPGENLLLDLPPEATGPAWSGEALFAVGADGACASITKGADHLILHLVDQGDGRGEDVRAHGQVELYDLAEDPDCLVDRVFDDLERARELRAALLAWLARARPTGWASAGEEVTGSAERVGMLAELGYAGDGPATGELGLDSDCDCEWCTRFR